MFSNLFKFSLLLTVLFVGGGDVFGQEAKPTPSPEKRQISQAPKKRTSGVKILPDEVKPVSTPAPTPDTTVDSGSSTNGAVTVPVTGSDKDVAPANAEKAPVLPKGLSEDEILAGQAALDREKKKASDEAAARLKEEYDKREADLNARLEEEKRQREADQAKAKQDADAAEARRLEEKKRLEDEAEANRIRQAEAVEAEKQRMAVEAENEKRRLADASEVERRRLQEETDAEKKKLLDEKADSDRKALEASTKNAELERQAKEAKEKAEAEEAIRVETARIAAENTAKQNEAKAKLRADLIVLTAKKLKFLAPEIAAGLVPESAIAADEIESALQAAAKKNLRLVKHVTFCDQDYQGGALNLEMTADSTISTLLQEIRYTFPNEKINFIPDAEILDLPVRVNVSNEPWNQVLRSQLNFNDLEARCTGNNTIAILKRSKLLTLQESQRKTSPIVTKLVKFKYLQPEIGGTVDVAGRSSGGGANPFESLEGQIQKILASDSRASVARVPGKNQLIIRATEDLLNEIETNIAAADVPSYQVIIYATIYTANKNRLKDIGGNVSIIAGTGNLNQLGGLTNFPKGAESGSSGGDSETGGSSTGPGSVTPGGVRSLGPGFAFPQGGGISAGFSGILGSNQFAAQLNLMIQNGVAEVKNSPTTVTDDNVGSKIDLGRQIPIAIPIFSGGVAGNANLQILNAGNTLAVTPQVIEDENGKPTKVRLSLQLESNEPDTSIQAQGIPTIQRRSSQNRVTIGVNETVVIGGFTTLTRSKSTSKAPLLGDIPAIGYLFKRKVDQEQEVYIYFAVRAEIRMNGKDVTAYPIDIDTKPVVPVDSFFRPAGSNPAPVVDKP